MRTNFIDGVSKERVAELRNSPKVVKFLELMKKIKSSTATAAERDEYEAKTKRARELNPNVLVD